MGPELGLHILAKRSFAATAILLRMALSAHLAFGIGTSEVEHVMATQCLQQSKAKTMEVRFIGKRKPGVTAKDMILGVIAQIRY